MNQIYENRILKLFFFNITKNRVVTKAKSSNVSVVETLTIRLDSFLINHNG